MTTKSSSRRGYALPDAVLFDFDGVISDTEPLHWRAFCEVLKPIGASFSWREYMRLYLGFDDRGVFRESFKQRGKTLPKNLLKRLLREKADAFERIVRSENILPYAGCVQLIRRIRRQEIPLALCTGALRRDIRPLLQRFGLVRAFDVIVTADDVRESKPDPRAYLLALRRLRTKFPQRQIRARCCVAIEDTPAGIQAARGAGMKVLAVCNTYPEAQLWQATWIVKSLNRVSPQAIGAHVLQESTPRRMLLR